MGLKRGEELIPASLRSYAHIVHLRNFGKLTRLNTRYRLILHCPGRLLRLQEKQSSSRLSHRRPLLLGHSSGATISLATHSGTGKLLHRHSYGFSLGIDRLRRTIYTGSLRAHVYGGREGLSRLLLSCEFSRSRNARFYVSHCANREAGTSIVFRYSHFSNGTSHLHFAYILEYNRYG